MKTLRRLDKIEAVTYVKTDDRIDMYYLHTHGEHAYLPFTLIRENNRGWTLESRLMGSGKTTIFLSRGDWEMV